MGKYGIGARVRDEDGDEGVIIDKRKGDRLVRFRGYDLWLAKSSLTAIPLKLEIGKTYVDRDGGEHGPLVANALGRYEDTHPFSDGNNTWAADGKFLFDSEGEDGLDLVAEVVERPSNGSITLDFANAEMRVDTGDPEFKVGQRVALKTSATWGDHGVGEVVPASTDARDGMVGVVYPRDDFKWHFEPRELTPFTLEAGKFYRTRDGRKVGPMAAYNGYSKRSYPWTADSPEHGLLYAADGINYDGADDPCTIVAEWVEPEAAAAKFKVGDRVVRRNYMAEGDCYGTVDGFRPGGRVHASDWTIGCEEGYFHEDNLELAPAIPAVGSKVTLTGTVTGIQPNGGNVNVTLDACGGRCSMDFPSASLRAA